MNKIDVPSSVIARAVARRGSVNIYERLDPAKTALLVVDMQAAFTVAGYAGELETGRGIIDNVNRLAKKLRSAGGHVFWIKHTHVPSGEEAWPRFGEFASAWGNSLTDTLIPGHPGHELNPNLDVHSDDSVVLKTRYSAFIQNSSDLHQKLQKRGIDTVIVTGVVTNVCCESTARDAMMLNYKVHFVADANAAKTDEEHNATLGTMMLWFADVRSTSELVELIPTNP